MMKAGVLMLGLALTGFAVAQDSSADVVTHIVTLSGTIDNSSIRDALLATKANLKMDHLVNKSIHLSDRRFAHIG